MTARRTLCSLLSLLAAPLALAQYDDGHGKVWRQLTATRGFQGDEVSSVCSSDGVTPCDGVVRGVDFTGWRWATAEQVLRLFSYFEPQMLQQTTLAGPEYTLTAMFFFNSFAPTYEFHIVSTSYQFGGGWTCDFLDDGAIRSASVSARWPAFNGTWTVDGAGPAATGNPQMGIWLWRPALRAGDVDCDGLITVSDIGPFVLALTEPTTYATQFPECTSQNADTNADGAVTVSDVSAFVTLLTAG